VERATAGLAAERALEWLHALGESLQAPTETRLAARGNATPLVRVTCSYAICDRITLAGIVSARLTPSAHTHGFVLALPEKVELVRPTGVGHAPATYEIPIEGRDEWLAAAESSA
jgi:hypothetical protein